MFPRLSVLLEPRLKLSRLRRNHQTRDVALRGPGQHVRHVVLMPRRIQQSKSLGGCGKGRLSHFHRLSLRSLLRAYVHHVRQEPSVPSQRLRLLFELLQLNGVHFPRLQQDVPADRRLPRVHVSDEHDVQRLSALVHLRKQFGGVIEGHLRQLILGHHLLLNDNLRHVDLRFKDFRLLRLVPLLSGLFLWLLLLLCVPEGNDSALRGAHSLFLLLQVLKHREVFLRNPERQAHHWRHSHRPHCRHWTHHWTHHHRRGHSHRPHCIHIPQHTTIPIQTHLRKLLLSLLLLLLLSLLLLLLLLLSLPLIWIKGRCTQSQLFL